MSEEQNQASITKSEAGSILLQEAEKVRTDLRAKGAMNEIVQLLDERDKLVLNIEEAKKKVEKINIKIGKIQTGDFEIRCKFGEYELVFK